MICIVCIISVANPTELVCASEVLDIVFLVAVSDVELWQDVKDFMTKVIDTLPSGSDQVSKLIKCVH